MKNNWPLTGIRNFGSAWTRFAMFGTCRPSGKVATRHGRSGSDVGGDSPTYGENRSEEFSAVRQSIEDADMSQLQRAADAQCCRLGDAAACEFLRVSRENSYARQHLSPSRQALR